MSGLLLGIVLSVCTCWFHNMVTFAFLTCFYWFCHVLIRVYLSNFTPVSLHMLKCSCTSTVSCLFMYFIIIIMYIICTFEDETITMPATSDTRQSVTRHHTIEERRAKQLPGLKMEGQLGFPLPREKTGKWRRNTAIRLCNSRWGYWKCFMQSHIKCIILLEKTHNSPKAFFPSFRSLLNIFLSISLPPDDPDICRSSIFPERDSKFKT